MSFKRQCPFYRDSETLNIGRGIGYCDLDCDRTTCEGDVKFCEKPDALKQYLRRKLNEFEKKEDKGE